MRLHDHATQLPGSAFHRRRYYGLRPRQARRAATRHTLAGEKGLLLPSTRAGVMLPARQYRAYQAAGLNAQRRRGGVRTHALPLLLRV